MRFVLYETQRKNIVAGYTLTRLAPLGDDPKQRDELCRMLDYIDPCISLSAAGVAAGGDMSTWYRETFGVPGTPEFEENVRKMNEKLNNNA